MDKKYLLKSVLVGIKFCVGDCFYHELTMVTDGLPKSYLVKQRRDQLNKICHVTPTPGVADAYGRI